MEDKHNWCLEVEDQRKVEAVNWKLEIGGAQKIMSYFLPPLVKNYESVTTCYVRSVNKIFRCSSYA